MTTQKAQRRLQIALGLIWLADGALQLQPFMFRRSFVTEIIAPNAVGQPGVVAGPVTFALHLIGPRVALFNAFAAAIQIVIGLGILYAPTVKPALLMSFGWALGVWWVGEGLGGLLTGRGSPLTGARARHCCQSSAAAAAAGHGTAIAIVAACLSAAVGLGVLFHRCDQPLLALSVGIALFYFVVGQGIGGVLTGSGTDPGTGPLLVLLAARIYGFDRSHVKRPALRSPSWPVGSRLDVALDSGEPPFVAYGPHPK